MREPGSALTLEAMKALLWLIFAGVFIGVPGYYYYDQEKDIALRDATFDSVQVGDPAEMLDELMDTTSVRRHRGESMSGGWADGVDAKDLDEGAIGDILYRQKALPNHIIWQFQLDADGRVVSKYRFTE